MCVCFFFLLRKGDEMEKTSGNQTGFTKSKYHCEVRYCSTHQIHHTCALSISVSAHISKQTGILEDCLSKYSIKFSGPCQIPKLYSNTLLWLGFFFYLALGAKCNHFCGYLYV